MSDYLHLIPEKLVTDKKENILNAALELFANDGYKATSTNKIAKKAGVSEGLIFRHFENKKELLNAILQDVEVRISQIFAPIIFEQDATKVIQKTIEMPFTIEEKEYDFWRLQFKLKWEKEYYNPSKMKPVIDKLAWALEQLAFPNPQVEAELLSQIIESISINILREGSDSQKHYLSFLKNKYQV